MIAYIILIFPCIGDWGLANPPIPNPHRICIFLFPAFFNLNNLKINKKYILAI